MSKTSMTDYIAAARAAEVYVERERAREGEPRRATIDLAHIGGAPRYRSNTGSVLHYFFV